MASRFSFFFLLILTLFALPSLNSAEEKDLKPNPVMMARVDGVNDASAKSKALQIESLDAKVAVRGMIAQTELTIRFSNPSNQTLEGEFTLDMPLNSVVSGYALDVNSAMVDGVLVPPYKARQAYEQRVARRVDPGIVEVSHGSRFTTRVFPIFPNRGRTIRLSFVTPLDPQSGYELPFGSSVNVGSLSLAISGIDAKLDHQIVLPRGLKGQSAGGNITATARNVQLGGMLAIRPAKATASVTLSEFRGEGRFFEIVDKGPAAANRTATGGRLTILWDRSRSRIDNDLESEIALVTAYLAKARPDAIRLIRFDSSGAEVADVANGTALVRAIKETNYGGGTSFAVLDKAILAGADTCLLFSDGIATLDRRDGFAPACRLFSIASTREADRGFLGSRARRAGGDLIDLLSTKMEDAATRMANAQLSIVSVTDVQGNPLDTATFDGGPEGWRLVGEAPERGDVIVRISGLGKSLVERRYAMPSTAPIFNGPGALWAASSIGSRSAEVKSSELLKLARQYSVASPIAAFVVLETPQDYAQAEINPPTTYPKDQRAIYASLRDQGASILAGRKKAQLGNVLAERVERERWWTNPLAEKRARGARRQPPAPPPPVAPLPMPAPPPMPVSAPQPQMERSAPSEPPLPPPPPQVEMTAPPVMESPAPAPAAANEAEDDSGADQIVVTGTQRANGAFDDMPASFPYPRRPEPGARRESKIKIQPNGWNSDRPYLKTLDAATGDFNAVFAGLEKEYGALPAFYLDVSGWLANKGRKAEAARMATSALDLPARNNDTIAIVAARLTKLGQLDRAIWLLEQMAELENDRPQPKRTLALALIQRAAGLKGAAAKADLQRAYDLLAEVINTPWDGRYAGVEQIALNDATAILPRLKSLGGTGAAIDPRLLRNLDTDIRVVVEWNTKSTDMDLWVDEPDGERIMYDNPKSAAGGHLSNDMTQGFGPEEYFIRKAPAGKFTVRINTFATDRLNPNGPTTVTARLYRNFGRVNQSEELIDLEVMPGSEGQKRIGTISIGVTK